MIGLAEKASGQTRSLGLDISAWQGNISQTTWNNLYNNDNRDFVFLRSSRGGTTGYYNQSNAGNDNPPGQNTLSQRYDDPYFVQNINRATTAGMFAGSYHFGRPDIVASTLNSGGIANTGTDEADHMIQMAGAWMRPGYLLPVFDLEAGQAERTMNQLAQFSIDFSNRIYAVMGIRPAIYVNGNYANDLQGASSTLQDQVVEGFPTLWTARWPNQSDPDSIPVQTAHPNEGLSTVYGPWDDSGVTHPWAFWQYASTGRLQSYNSGNSNLDFDVAQGGTEFLKDRLVPALWMNDSSGQWTTLANWNSGQTPVAPVTGPGQVAPVGTQTLPTPRLPGAAGSGVTAGQNDTVILDRTNANITVTLASGTHNIRKLYAREALNVTGGSLNINYTPVAESSPISAQFSADVSLSGNASLSVHTLQVDTTRTFTLGGGTLTLNRVNLMPHFSIPAKILVNGDVILNPLANAAALIANGSGSGSSGLVDLSGANRTFTVGDGFASTDLTIGVPISNGALTKSGAGTLALTGSHSYVGDTVVQQGVLSINTAYLANAADVLLNTGGTLSLNFGGAPDVIDSLFIDGAAQAIGTWGSLSSAAQFTTPLITGTGLLQVTSTIMPPTPGDFDGDDDVDGRDFLAWQRGESPNSLSATDLAEWQAAYNGGALAAATAVPEPATLHLLLLSLLVASDMRRK